MKNSIYISGLIGAVGLTLGAMFKIQHFPGAAILLAVFISFFTLVFLPFALWNNYKKEKKNAFLHICIFITLLICFGAALFKILHWPGAGILILAGLLAPFIIFLPAYIVYYNKQSNKDITHFIAILFLLVFVGLWDAFLALNVSKRIINYAILTDQTNNQITNVLEQRNERMYENLQSSQPVLLNAQQIVSFKIRTDELCNFIDELRFSLVNAEDINNENCISETGDINISELLGKDKTSMAVVALLQTDKALDLKNQIENYRDYVKGLKLEDFPYDLDEIFNVNDINYEDQQISWERVQFEGPLMVWALQKLDMIKMKVRIVESEVLTTGFSPGSEV